jgi:hypothetical protein
MADDNAHRRRTQQIAQLQRNANLVADHWRWYAAHPDLVKQFCARVIARIHEKRAEDAGR